jgi:plasmid stabilization system protein ParE
MLNRASDDLDNIYNYIADEFKEIGTAENMADILEKAILSLGDLPYRGTLRKTGAFANKNYRQLFVKNFTIVYRIDEKKKMVIIVTIRYKPSSF